MNEIKFTSGDSFPMEMHKAKIVKKLELKPIDERLKCIQQACNNTFLLHNSDIFLDMLTDSGTNAMSDKQQSALLLADDTYAGSESFFKLQKTCQELFGKKFLIPAHQGRACENLLSRALVNKGDVTLMNYHFTTTKAHILENGGSVEELIIDEGLDNTSNFPFKGNMDIDKLKSAIKRIGVNKIAFVRMEAGTNLIGGQPFSLANLKEVSKVCRENGIKLILDASLLTDNLYFIATREKPFNPVTKQKMTIEEITLEMSKLCDIVYFSARKLGSARGGAILLDDEKLNTQLKELVTLFEGFITYGGMSIMEIEAINQGLKEAMDFFMINQGPEFIKFLVDGLTANGVPMITPSGGLGAHIDAKAFLSHIPQDQYPSGALCSALFIVGGIRAMERGTISENRNEDGTDHFAKMELVRLACPRRVFTISHLKFVIDRVSWLYKNRNLIGGLKWVEEPKILRFFVGKLAPIGDWQEKLVAKFKADFGESL